MNAEIILIGAQFDDQQNANTYAHFLSKYIADFGIDNITLVLTGNSKVRLQKALEAAVKRSGIIITVGGFDINGEVFANSVIFESLDLQTYLNDKEFARIKRMYSALDMILPQGYEKQAMFPRECEIFINTVGIVSGCALKSGRQCIITLPDLPHELEKMAESYLLDFLTRFTDYKSAKTILKTSGISYEELNQTLGDLINGTNPTVKLLESGGETSVELTAYALTKPLALNAIEPVAGEIHKRLGNHLYGVDDDSLLKAAVKLLKNQKLKVALGESGTSGFLTKALGSLAGAGGILEYGVTADLDRTKQQLLDVPQNILQRCGPVSQQTAAAMASGAKKRSNADIGLAVTADIKRGGEFGSFDVKAYVAVCSDGYVWVKQLDFTEYGEKEYIINLICSQLLDILRLYLLNLPHLLPGYIPISQAMRIILYNPGKRINGGENETTPEPIKVKKGGSVLKKIFLWLFVAVFIVSVGYLGVHAYNSYKNKQLADDLNGKLSQSSAVPDGFPSDYLKKFASLYAVNSDIKGWLSIDNTPLSYPVVQAADNDFYLRKDFYKNKNDYGVPFLDYEVKIKPQSTNTLIYGHNMKDGQMFGELVKYKNIAYYKAHPIINFDSVYEENKYKIVAILITNANPKDGEIFDYTSFINSDKPEELALFAANAKVRSFINIEDDELKVDDKLLTLSTCTYEFSDARFVIVARKLREGENSDIDVSKATVNKSPLLPDVWYKTYGKTKPESPIAVPTLATIYIPSSSVPQVSSSSSQAVSSSSAVVSSSGSVKPPASSAASSSKPPSSKVTSSSKPASTSPSSVKPSSSSSSSIKPSSSVSSSVVPSSSHSVSSSVSVPVSNDTIRVDTGSGEQDYSTYDILCQIVSNEMGSTTSKEALKAQAVASYTYIKYENAGGRTPSVSLKTPSSAVQSAVRDVLGKKIYYNNEIISATYFSSSCGKTANSFEYWNGEGKPYLVSVDSSVDTNASGYKSTKTYSVSEMKNMLESTFNVSLSDTPENWIKVTDKYSSGYVKKVSIDGQRTATGRDIREDLCSYALRSTCFDVKFDGSSFVFTTYGYGHGVGLSQWGAMLYAKQGWSYTQILTHYYSGTTVK